MSHPYFSHVSLGLSLIPTFFGLNMLFRPGPTLESVKFPVPADPEGKKTIFSVMRFFGARNIAVSYLLVLIWSRGDNRLTAKSLVACLWIAGVDGFIQRAQTGEGQWTHWGFIPVVAGVAAGLMGWLN
ncbi:unnamed protein product [Clonostachys byssicola]|uniref:Uncharacterized protein n=1 Tax=Clonostachys byssicola TaxID=160290 RepID=A0A9N9UCK3_9HYPO|nr:unnamed protein product [Clonostachys byssicola]